MSKLKVFVSSVQKELGLERAAVPQLIAIDPFLDKHCEAVRLAMKLEVPSDADS